MLGSVFRTAAEFGDRALFDSILAAAKKEQDPRIRETLIGALGSFRNPELASAAMNLFLNKTFDIRESFFLLFGPQLPFSGHPRCLLGHLQHLGKFALVEGVLYKLPGLTLEKQALQLVLEQLQFGTVQNVQERR